MTGFAPWRSRYSILAFAMAVIRERQRVCLLTHEFRDYAQHDEDRRIPRLHTGKQVAKIARQFANRPEVTCILHIQTGWSIID